ncbi:MAG: ubiquinol-cytochrome C chaperone family protein [Pseudomonadota bacterium]
MLGALRKLFIPKPPAAVVATYIALVAAARNPFFFTTAQVPDTIDGRFELIVLHQFLIQHRLVADAAVRSPAGEPERSERGGAVAGAERPLREALEQFGQFLSEAFFADMDRSLREMGIADTGVSKRIKKMGKSYHGSLQAYAAGLSDAAVLRTALARNLYGTVEQGDVAQLDRMARYIETMTAQLAAIDTATILEGHYRWPDAATLA